MGRAARAPTGPDPSINLAPSLHDLAPNRHEVRSGAAGPHTNLTTMQRAPTHSLPDDTYISPYSTFSTPIQHGNPASDPKSSSFGISSPPEHHTPHQHIEHTGLHIDPNLSTRSNRQVQASESDDYDIVESSTPLNHDNAVALPPTPANDAPTPHFDMLPPADSTHPSWQALHAYAQNHASLHGYALSINTTAKNRSRIKLACVCYGAPKNTHKLTPETRVRKNRVSYKTGCKMWVEGKKMEDGLWMLRVGEAEHNHAGRPSEGWALQRKRTWGVQGGRVGSGGIIAQEEREQQQLGSIDQGQHSQDNVAQVNDTPGTPHEGVNPGADHSFERGSLAWKIIEEEMQRKGVGGEGRDRGVGRTIKILEERLPGIHMFKRDVYNIRAQIKRARQAAGQPLDMNTSLSGDQQTPHADPESSSHPQSHPPAQQLPEQHPDRHPQQHPQQQIVQGAVQHERDGFSQIDPILIAQCNSALEQVPQVQAEDQQSEIDRLRKEVESLRHALGLRTKEVEEKNAENENLRGQLELANVALYNRQGEGEG